VRAESGPHPSWMRRRGAATAAALALTVLVSGCGFVNALAHPATTADVGSGPAPGSAPASASPSPVIAAAADLAGSLDGRPASLRVAVAGAKTGVPPELPPAACRLAPDATEYAAVSVIFTSRSLPTKQTGVSSNLRLDLSVAGTNGLGVIAIDGPATPCADTSGLSATTTLQTEDLADEHQTVTVYVVARTSRDTPDPLRGVTLQLSNPRHHPDDIDSRAWTWNLSQVTTGSTCPADPNSLCVSMG
jgi:hypothetical protein